MKKKQGALFELSCSSRADSQHSSTLQRSPLTPQQTVMRETGQRNSNSSFTTQRDPVPNMPRPLIDGSH